MGDMQLEGVLVAGREVPTAVRQRHFIPGLEAANRSSLIVNALELAMGHAAHEDH